MALSQRHKRRYLDLNIFELNHNTNEEHQVNFTDEKSQIEKTFVYRHSSMQLLFKWLHNMS